MFLEERANACFEICTFFGEISPSVNLWLWRPLTVRLYRAVAHRSQRRAGRHGHVAPAWRRSARVRAAWRVRRHCRWAGRSADRRQTARRSADPDRAARRRPLTAPPPVAATSAASSPAPTPNPAGGGARRRRAAAGRAVRRPQGVLADRPTGCGLPRAMAAAEPHRDVPDPTPARHDRARRRPC